MHLLFKHTALMLLFFAGITITSQATSSALSQSDRDLRILEQIATGLLTEMGNFTARASSIPGLGIYIDIHPTRPQLAGISGSFDADKAETLLREFYTGYISGLNHIPADEQVYVYLHSGSVPRLTAVRPASEAAPVTGIALQASRTELNQRRGPAIRVSRISSESISQSDRIFLRILSATLQEEGLNHHQFTGNVLRLDNASPIFTFHLSLGVSFNIPGAQPTVTFTSTSLDSTIYHVYGSNNERIVLRPGELGTAISPDQIESIAVRTDSLLRLVEIRLREADESLQQAATRIRGTAAVDSARVRVARVQSGPDSLLAGGVRSISITRPPLAGTIDWNKIGRELTDVLVSYGNTVQNVTENASIHVLLNSGSGVTSIQVKKSDLNAFQRGSISEEQLRDRIQMLTR